jgi:hypothetical protein
MGQVACLEVLDLENNYHLFNPTDHQPFVVHQQPFFYAIASHTALQHLYLDVEIHDPLLQ